MTRILLLLFFLPLLLPATPHATPATLTGKVLWVYDGDTIKVENIGKVRLLGIDTPEKEDSERDRHYLKLGIDRAHLRLVAREAMQFMIQSAKGQVVTLHTDRETEDRHGRLLAYVYLPNGQLINRALLEQGLAAVYRKFAFRMKEDFLAAEKKAQANRAGLWSSK